MVVTVTVDVTHADITLAAPSGWRVRTVTSNAPLSQQPLRIGADEWEILIPGISVNVSIAVNGYSADTAYLEIDTTLQSPWVTRRLN